MSSVPAASATTDRTNSDRLPLAAGDPGRAFCWRDGGPIGLGRYLDEAHGLSNWLRQAVPDAAEVLNLCEDRYRFLVLLGAALLAGRPSLLPSSRAPSVVEEMLARHPAAVAVGDDAHADGVRLSQQPSRYVSMPVDAPRAHAGEPDVAGEQLAVVGYTSGSSGIPAPHRKSWRSFRLSTLANLRLLDAFGPGPWHVVATVPPQHMYGMETSVLLPMLGPVCIHSGRPFFPADIMQALAELPAPRILVTTPVHLRSLIESGLPNPPLELILSATAPLGQALAADAERATGARVLELFGSTETCVIGHRRTAEAEVWCPQPGVSLDPDEMGTSVSAPWLPVPVLLQDRMQIEPDGGFRLVGRCSDHLEIAGKRASLLDITQRLLALPGVEDAAVFVPASSGKVTRLAALVVAPGLDAPAILAALRETVDAVFLPRPLRLVARLPRNETGKLPRQALLDALARTN